MLTRRSPRAVTMYNVSQVMLSYGTIIMYSLFLIDELDIIPYINV